MQIPVHKLLQSELELWMKGSWLKESGIHTGGIAGNDVFIFLRGVVPKPCDFIDVLVDALLCVFAHKPHQFHICLGQ